MVNMTPWSLHSTLEIDRVQVNSRERSVGVKMFFEMVPSAFRTFFFFLKKKTRISEAGSKKVIGMFAQ